LSDADAKRELIKRFWATLYERDFDGVGAFFAADGEYTDMPTPPEDVARGPAQIAARLRLGLEPLESIFGERQRQLAEALREANRQLARAIAEDKGYTPRVNAAVEHVHHCMGDLQKASIKHVFAMRAVLSPEQGDKLLVLARQALEQSP